MERGGVEGPHSSPEPQVADPSLDGSNTISTPRGILTPLVSICTFRLIFELVYLLVVM